MTRIASQQNIILNTISIILMSIFILYIQNYLFTFSGDLAHHYALVDNLSKYLGVNNSFGNLGEMANYPNFSHWLAVIFGALFDSNISGMSFVSVLSLLTIWLTISIFILHLKPLESFLTLLLILLFGIFSDQIGAFYGKEIVGNFFYSQLVAEAFAFLVLLVTFFMFERKRLLVLVLMLSSLLLPFFHLLPAMQILGLSFLIAFHDMYKSKKFDYTVLSILFIGLVLFLLHPSFADMRSIGNNNGDLSFPFMPSPTELDYDVTILLILVSIVLPLYFIISEKFVKYTPIKIISLFSLSNSILMLLQTIALSMGHGSEYAVKKYIFTLITLMVVLICILIAFFANKFLENKYDYTIALPRFFVASIFSSILIVMQLGHSPSYLLDNLKDIEKNLHKYENNYTQDRDKHKAIYLDRNNVLQYMFSISILEHPRDGFGMTLLSGSNIENAIYSNDVSYIFVKNNYFIDKTSKNFVSNNSAFLNLEGYFALDKETFLRAMETKYSDIQSDNGLKISEVPQILKSGWNNIENWGVWSSADVASLFVQYPLNKTYNNFSFTANSWYKDRNITVKINGIDCGSLIIYANKNREYSVSCPIDFRYNLKIDFYIEDGNVSPKKLKLSEDSRNLGIGLSNVKVY